MTLQIQQRSAWIGVFDVLGFKNLVQQADREFPRALLTSKLEDLLAVLKSNAFDKGSLRSFVFSDTFVILASDLEPKSYPWFLTACRDLFTKSIYLELPLRGAISQGPVFFSPEPLVVLGSAFLEAYEYGQAQDWIGLLLAPSARTALENVGLNPLHHGFASDEIPSKKGMLEGSLPYGFRNGRTNFKHPIITHLEQMRHFAPGDQKYKYDRTIAFLNRNMRRIDRKGAA